MNDIAVIVKLLFSCRIGSLAKRTVGVGSAFNRGRPT
jgi:hypothetical protein